MNATQIARNPAINAGSATTPKVHQAHFSESVMFIYHLVIQNILYVMYTSHQMDRQAFS